MIKKVEQEAEPESPLKKFDAPTLKGIGGTEITSVGNRAQFLPANMAEAMELGKLMAAGNFVPGHLRGKPGDCLAIIMQASRWGMDPFAVANKTYFVNDRMAYEAQLVAAVVNSSGLLNGRLSPRWEGQGNDLVCTVSCKIKGDDEVKTRRVEIKNISVRNSPLWKQDPEQQLGYYAIRAWARLHTPEVLLGVYTKEEIEEIDGGTVKNQPLTKAMLEEQAGDGTVEQVDGEVIEAGEDAEPDEQEERAERPTWSAKYDELITGAMNAVTLDELKAIDDDFVKHAAVFPDEQHDEIDQALREARSRITAASEKAE
ncbi:recombinase RecT [Parasphingorhabdus sp.]|uniref:recombinase RecT n=1 Tax=Parasphingorhabdus sp. TaxID=2709688 RepID=UPI003A921027